MSRWLVPVVVVLLALALRADGSVPGGRTALAQATPVANPATPVASQPTTFVREQVGQVAVPGSPAGQRRFVTLTRVTLASAPATMKDWVRDGAGLAPMATHPHAGPSVLFVESGVVCYQASAQGGGLATLTATTGPNPLSDAYAGEVGCQRPVATDSRPCAQGCQVQPTGPILLVAGESIAHEGPVDHRFWAPGREGAVVYISELQVRGAAGPCAGGCH